MTPDTSASSSSRRGRGLERRIVDLLEEANRAGGYHLSLVCTEQGLLVAEAGKSSASEELAALGGLFDDVVERARRDLALPGIDEVTLRAGNEGRFVIRPLVIGEGHRMFLFVHAPPDRPWRRTTANLVRALQNELVTLYGAPS